MYTLKCLSQGHYIKQYNTVKPNLMGSAVLLRFRDSFGFKKSKDKEKNNSRLDLSVYPIDSV